MREYEYVFYYEPGRLNVNADALSRNPVVLPIVPTGKPETAARQSSSIAKHLERLRSSAVKAAEANASTIGERVRLRRLASNPSLAQPPPIRRTKTIADIPMPPTETRKVGRSRKQPDTGPPIDPTPPVPHARNSAFPSLASNRLPLSKASEKPGPLSTKTRATDYQLTNVNNQSSEETPSLTEPIPVPPPKNDIKVPPGPSSGNDNYYWDRRPWKKV